MSGIERGKSHGWVYHSINCPFLLLVMTSAPHKPPQDTISPLSSTSQPDQPNKSCSLAGTILSTTIDYGHLSRKALVDQMRLRGIHPSLIGRFEDRFRWSYKGDTTAGMAFSEIGRQLIEAGFDPNVHKIFSWFTRVDHDCLGRAIACDTGLDDLLVNKDPSWRQQHSNTGDNAFQPLNLAWILQQTRLELVHPALCPRSSVSTYQNALQDKIALEEVFKAVLERTAWVTEDGVLDEYPTEDKWWGGRIWS